MSEKEHEKQVFSYMDGIPVKISEKYKPPRRIILPVGFQNRLLQPPVSADYDFDREEQILNKLQQWRDLRWKEKQKRKDRIDNDDAKLRSVEKTDTIQDLPVENDINSANASTTAPSPVVSTAPETTQVPVEPTVCAPMIRETNPILRPIPIKHHVVTSQINNNKPISAFNLSDFEADTSSPFDNMELKTINDLEELAQVLQPSAVLSQPSGYFQNTMPSGQYAAMHHIVNQNQSFNPTPNLKMLNDSKTVVSYQSHLNGLTSNYSVYNGMAPNAIQMVDLYQVNVAASNYHPSSGIPASSSSDQPVTYHYMDREQATQSTTMRFESNSQEPHSKVQGIYRNSIWPSCGSFRGNDSSSRPFVSNTHCELSHNPGFTSSPSSSPDQSGDRSPSSESAVGAIAQELSQLLKLKSSKPNTTLMNLQLPSIEHESPNQASPMVPEDPCISLQPEDQVLATKITEMGFPFGRVARACKAFRGNDKKVVESLLSLQSLLDAGYPEDRAEHALLLNDYDVRAANRFLQAETQLLDLGFPVKQVAEALLKFNCDRDKALDFLIT